MRTLGIALLLVAAQLPASAGQAQAPKRDGTFKTADGKSFPWRIDGNHSLVWNGERYVPVGLRVDGTPAAVDAANTAGIKDLLIDLPASGSDWSATIDRAEANGQRYVLRIASLAPSATGVAVDPAAYRIAGTRGAQHIDLAMPGVKDALVVTALKRDGSLLGTATVKTANDRLVYDTKVHADLETVILIYPRTGNLEIPDFWDGLDSHRDTLLARLKRTRFGAGLRGIVNPLGRTMTLPGREIRGVPSSPAFQAELAELLQAKHTNVEGAMQAWSLKASALTTGQGATNQRGTIKTTFPDLARLVPLWSGNRGVPQLWDPVSDKVFACDKDKSRIWEDITETVARAAARRVQRLCRAMRQVVDVPIAQEWSGWAGITEDPESPFDGIAARVGGDAGTELADSAARAVSTVARWKVPGWLVATDVDVPVAQLDASLGELANLGVRAAFVRGPIKEVGIAATARASNPPADYAIDPVFFPENAANPAAVQRLPGGRWWLPTPQDGNRLDFGSQFFGYRIASAKGTRLVLWAKTPGRYLLRMVHPEVVTVNALDGSNPDPKKAKNGLILTLGQVPVELDCRPDDLPVPELALKEMLDQFTALGKVAEAGRRVGTDEIYTFTQAATGFETNPGGSFAAMRVQLRKFAALLSPLSWVEAESSADTNFSETYPIPGASNGQALALRALMPPAEGFYATYNIPVATKSDVELWVAAKIAPERRSELSAEVGGQTLTVTEAPMSSYGAGFAWFRLGTTRLSGNVGKVTLRMRSGVGAEAAIDTIVLAPSGWRPSGVAYPVDAAIPSP